MKKIIIIIIVMLSAYSIAHGAALDNASIHVQAVSVGKPMPGAPYQLSSAYGLIAGRTDANGMVVATGIDAGMWALDVGCTTTLVEAAEVHGQVTEQVDASCRLYLPVAVK